MNTVFFIVNFNTQKLTSLCVNRVLKLCTVLEPHVFVLDNSTRERFEWRENGPVTVLDNTGNGIIDYAAVKRLYCKTPTYVYNGFASLKHCFAIDWAIKNLGAPEMVIMDSDAILRKGLDFIDKQYVTAGEVRREFGVERIVPIVQYINAAAINAAGMSYFDPTRMHGGLNSMKNAYDTGCSFFEDVKARGMPYFDVKIEPDYAFHLGGASWKQVSGQKIDFDGFYERIESVKY